MIVGMFAFGLGLGAIEAYRRRNSTSLVATLIYAYSVPFAALLLRGEFTTMAGAFISGFVFLIVAARWTGDRHLASPATHSVWNRPAAPLTLAVRSPLRPPSRRAGLERTTVD
jgi:hypothetical protein